MGNQTIGEYKVYLTLDDKNIYWLSTNTYEVTISVVRPVNTLPFFTDEQVLYSLAFIAENSFSFKLPSVDDTEQGAQNVLISFDNTEAPWLKYDSE